MYRGDFLIKIIKKAFKLYNSQCAATKILIFLGFACLLNTIFSVFFSLSASSPETIAIRSVMSSIFGYILGGHCLNNKFGSNGIQTIVAGLVSVLCLFVLIVLCWISTYSGTPSVIEIRNLLFASVGFLISKAKGE